jgi:hypothetical protein
VRLHLQPITFAEAAAFIAEHHRHHIPPQGWKFGIAVNDGTNVRGVIVVGRPVARHVDDGLTLEVTRCCTDGAKNAPSMLYGAAWRATKALGYTNLITYTLETEPGHTLKAAGWVPTGKSSGGSWDRTNSGRPRVDKHPLQSKIRWEAAS